MELEIALGPGSHTLQWLYAKDDVFSAGLDRVWLDQVSFVSGEGPVLDIGTALNQPALPWLNDSLRPWFPQTNTVAVPPGSHEITWSYRHTAAYFLGASQMWLDEVQLIPETLLLAPSGLQVGTDGAVSLYINGPPGRFVGIETSSDLVNWSSAGTSFIDSKGESYVTVQHPEPPRQRFYRTRLVAP